MATVITDLPFQDKISIQSTPTIEGYKTSTIQYGGNVSQTVFNGADAETSREEVYKVVWTYLEYRTPDEVAAGGVNELDVMRDFYQKAQTGFVRWKPFELPSSRIWRVVPKSLKIKQKAGCIFTAALNLELQYVE